MEFRLPQYLKDDFESLNTFPDDDWEEFVTMIIDIQSKSKQTRKKAFAYFAEKFTVDVDAIRSSAELLIFVLLEATRSRVSENELKQATGLPDPKASVLWSVFDERQDALREALKDSSIYIPKYKGLDWRLDVTLASRTCYERVEPSYAMALHLRGPEKKEDPVHFTCDIPNLLHAVEVLELALSNCNNYVKKVQRTLK